MITLQRRGIVDSYRGFSFSRPSTARDSKGRLYHPHNARFEAGKFGMGLLVEEGTTNLFVNVEALDVWRRTNVANVLVGQVAPDGSETAFKIVESAGESAVEHYLIQDGRVTTESRAYTFSVYAKAGERSWLVLQTNLTGSWRRAWFDLQAGVLGECATEFTSQITPVGNGWYRCEVTGIAGTPTAARGFLLEPAQVDAQYSYAGDGVSGLYVWRPQLEQKPYATTFTDSTRSPEVLAIPTAGVLSGEAGTIEFWGYVPRLDAAGSWYPFDCRYGSNANRIAIYGTTSQLRGLVGDGTTSHSTEVVPLQVGWNYIALSWGISGIRFKINTQTESNSDSNRGPTTLASEAYLGSAYSMMNHGNLTCYADLRISDIARTDEETLAAYQSNEPLPVDADTTLKLDFDGPDSQRSAKCVVM